MMFLFYLPSTESITIKMDEYANRRFISEITNKQTKTNKPQNTKQKKTGKKETKTLNYLEYWKITKNTHNGYWFPIWNIPPTPPLPL